MADAAGKDAPAAKGCRRACSRLGRWLGFLVRFLVFVYLSVIVKLYDVWHPLIEFPIKCEHPVLPGNQTGMKVLVAGYAKTGTRTICHALNTIGVRAYHSEDFHLMPWWDYVSWFRAQSAENSWTVSALIGRRTETPGVERDMLARAVSRCRMEAVALDGLERLMKPLYETSPDVKVIMLNWRTYEEWKKSDKWFQPKLLGMVLLNIYSGASTNAVPWGALVRLVDPAVGRPVERLLRSGGPAITEVSGPLTFLYHQMLNHRRQYETWYPPGLYLDLSTAEAYYAGFQEVKNVVPADRLLEWDHRKNTYEDLCRFLDISPCPAKGKMARAINTWIFERDFPVAANAVLALRLWLHWVNWKLYSALLSGLWRVAKCCWRSVRSSEGRPKTE